MLKNYLFAMMILVLVGTGARAQGADTTALWVAHGAAVSDTVVINCQGGPAAVLKFEEAGRSNLRYLPGYDRYQIAYLHQAQTRRTDWYRPGTPFMRHDAEAAVEETSAMLAQALTYFKQRGKVVFVIGTSYGAFVIQHYLAHHPSQADRYVLVAGRLDMTPAMVAETEAGWAGSFAEDGSTYLPADRTPDPADTPADRQARRVKNLLKAAIGAPRYTEALANADLSNVVYFYAANDQAVGALTPAEVDFLEARGATVTTTRDGHSDTFYRFIDAVMAGNLTL